MNVNIKGSHVRANDQGLVVTRGSRTLFLLGTSVEQTNKAKSYLANFSFDRIYKSAQNAPGMKNTRYIKISN